MGTYKQITETQMNTQNTHSAHGMNCHSELISRRVKEMRTAWRAQSGRL